MSKFCGFRSRCKTLPGNAGAVAASASQQHQRDGTRQHAPVRVAEGDAQQHLKHEPLLVATRSGAKAVRASVRAGQPETPAMARGGAQVRRISARTPGNGRLRRGACAHSAGTRLDDAPVAGDLRRTVKVLLQVHLHKLEDQVQTSLQVDDVAQPAWRRTARRVSRCRRAAEPLPLQRACRPLPPTRAACAAPRGATPWRAPRR